MTLVSETVSEDTGNELAVAAERSEVNEVTYVMITDSETNSPGNNDNDKKAMTATATVSVSSARDETLTPNKTTSGICD
ncbi:unnamed protein product [Trichobilharzia szidati]|nr:unnamed protein product [Trichobilharzia szidati]